MFSNYIRYIVNPYMDIDFLEYLSQYRGWYINKKTNIFDALFQSEFLVGITDYLAPELSNIPYAKRGKYNADDLLRHKIRYFYRRLSYFLNLKKSKYPSNFPMGVWLYKYCKHEIKHLAKELLPLFNIQRLSLELEEIKVRTNEESWHKITNPININLNAEVFLSRYNEK